MTTCQQDELYAAEANVTRGRELTLAEAQLLADELRDSPWWQRDFPNVRRVEVYGRPARERRSVGGWYPELAAGKVEMASGHLCERVICHELAHVLAGARYGSRSHDPWFARVYLEAVHQVMGPDAYLELWTAFEDAGIDHRI